MRGKKKKVTKKTGDNASASETLSQVDSQVTGEPEENKLDDKVLDQVDVKNMIVSPRVDG